MPRPVVLFSGPFSDRPLEDLAARAAEWGYGGLELATWGDHLEVQRALADETYCPAILDLLARQDLQVPVVAAFRVGQALCDVIDERHHALLPDYVWGDGDPEQVRERAIEEMLSTIQVAQRLGASVVSAFTGSPIWSYVVGWPAPSRETITAGFQRFARTLHPILDACRETGVRFALEVHPGQIAFDLYSAEAALDALDGRAEFGFTFDPSHLHWQGIEPLAFLRYFPDRIFHVHVKDAALTLDGRTGLLASYLPSGDVRRGWDFRSPGHGGIDWSGVIRGLNEIGYDGPLSVDWRDPGMNPEWGAADACQFVKRIDFDPAEEIVVKPPDWQVTLDALKREWTDRLVRIHPDWPLGKRFGQRVGRVVTVNCNGRALVDFQDGAWYDVPASTEFLIPVSAEEAAGQYEPSHNSAQARPMRQG